MPADVHAATDNGATGNGTVDSGELAADTAVRPLSAASDRNRTLVVRKFRGGTLPV
jgi:hypothetical protein